jgi:hypothetical protein
MQKIFKVSLLAVLSSLAVNSFASTAEVKVLEPQLNYQQLLTQRQVVDELLEQAVKIQNSSFKCRFYRKTSFQYGAYCGSFIRSV